MGISSVSLEEYSCVMKELLVEDELELLSEEDEKDDKGEFVRR